MAGKKLPHIPKYVQEQRQNLSELLKSDAAKVKIQFRLLNLQLTFNPIEAAPRPYDVIKGQCDLSAGRFLFAHSCDHSGARG